MEHQNLMKENKKLRTVARTAMQENAKPKHNNEIQLDQRK
jgi:hypothetical protein